MASLLCWAMLPVLCCAACAVPCHAVLCCAMPCCAVLKELLPVNIGNMRPFKLHKVRTNMHCRWFPCCVLSCSAVLRSTVLCKVFMYHLFAHLWTTYLIVVLKQFRPC